MKRGPETFTAFCDALCSDPSLTRAAALVGLNAATPFRWMADCQKHPENYTFTYGEYGEMTFAEAVKLAQRICNTLIISTMRRRALFGHEEPVTFQGEQKFRRRLDIPPNLTDPDMMELLYGCRDPYERDEKGNLIPLTITRQPSDTLSIAVARAYGGPEWRDQKIIDMRHSGGVVHIGAKAPPAPRTIAHSAATVIEQAEAEAEAISEEMAEEIETTAAEEAEDAALIPEIEPPTEEAAPDAPEVSADLDPTAKAEADHAEGGPSPLVANLFTELEKTKAKLAEKAAAAPVAPPARYISLAERGEGWKLAKHDDPDEGIGSGAPEAGRRMKSV